MRSAKSGISIGNCAAAVAPGRHLLAAGERVSDELRLRAKRDCGFAAQLCLAAVTRLFNAAGGRALSLNNPLQRQYRDLLAAVSHHSIVWDSVSSEYGRLMLKENA